MEELLTIGAASRAIGISPQALRIWILAGKISAQRTTSGMRLFAQSEVQRAARERQEQRQHRQETVTAA